MYVTENQGWKLEFHPSLIIVPNNQTFSLRWVEVSVMLDSSVLKKDAVIWPEEVANFGGK